MARSDPSPRTQTIPYSGLLTVLLTVLIITIPKKESAKKQEPKRINVS